MTMTFSKLDSHPWLLLSRTAVDGIFKPVKPTIIQMFKFKRVRSVGLAVAICLFIFYVWEGRSKSRTARFLWGYLFPEICAEDTCRADSRNIDWSRFAYTQYVTNTPYLCNSVMMFEALHRFKSKPDRLMMYPRSFDPDANPESIEGRLLLKARDEYGVVLQPVEIQVKHGVERTWAESYTKLLAFNQTKYRRVLSIDSDSLILQSMDELFLLPPCHVAMPRAYWLPDTDGRISTLSSQLILVQPSTFEFSRITAAIEAAGPNDFDMEIVNHLYGDSAMILPHRTYNMITAEFQHTREDHARYLGNDKEPWNAAAVLRELKFLHFSDWPLPKPWLAHASAIDSMKPSCFEEADCTDQEAWLGAYSRFKERRTEICGKGI